MIVRVHQPAELQLLLVVQTGCGMRFALGLRQRGQEHRSEDRDDGDDDKEFDEGEATKAV